MNKCLNGLMVVDMTRVLAGPLAGQMLGDMGAEVIKIERPVNGDDSRMFGPPFLKDENGQDTSQSPMYLSANRNKKSITLDFSVPAGKELLLKIIAQADVLIENYKVDDLQRYGLDYASLRTSFPRLIYCSITGYGQTGPYRKRPGYDSVFQAESGIMSVTGHPDGQAGGGPMKVGPSIADIITGLYASNAITAALYRRDQNQGSGEYIDISLLESMVCGLGHFATQYLVTGTAPKRMGSQGNGGVPAQVFDCTDGAVMMTAGNQGQYISFCKAIHREDLIINEKFTTNTLRVKNRVELSTILSLELQSWKSQDLIEALHRFNVPAGRINSLPEVFLDPHIQQRQIVQEVQHPAYGAIKLVKNPINFTQSQAEPDRAPPMLGEHTEEILKRFLNIDASQMQELRANQII
ncbi:CoA transferase [Rhodococcus sp. SRB_17]|nr:CoA transferase [Acidovorax sp. SRB_24]NMM92022.1 CoA transferase [Rhodococcus sp. SRB_17]